MYVLINMEVFGISQEYQYVELELDSKDGAASAQNVSALNNPTFFIPRPLQDVVAVKVLSAEIPFSYYVFNSNNNTFTLAESGSGGTATVTIPVGNYTSSSLATAFGTALTTASVSLGANTYTVAYSTLTQKFTITSTAAAGTTFTLTFGTGSDPGNTNPRFYLGFPGGSTTSNTTPALESPSIPQISGPNYLYINSETLGNISNCFLPANAQNLNRGLNGPQLAKIPITCNPGGVTYYVDPDPQKYFDLERLYQLTSFDLYCSLGNTSSEIPLNFNGVGFSVKIGVILKRPLVSRIMNPNVNNGARMVVG